MFKAYLAKYCYVDQVSENPRLLLTLPFEIPFTPWVGLELRMHPYDNERITALRWDVYGKFFILELDPFIGNKTELDIYEKQMLERDWEFRDFPEMVYGVKYGE